MTFKGRLLGHQL